MLLGGEPQTVVAHALTSTATLLDLWVEHQLEVATLLSFEDEPDLRHAIASFWSYQLPGLEGLRQRIQAHGGP